MWEEVDSDIAIEVQSAVCVRALGPGIPLRIYPLGPRVQGQDATQDVHLSICTGSHANLLHSGLGKSMLGQLHRDNHENVGHKPALVGWTQKGRKDGHHLYCQASVGGEFGLL